MFFDAKMLLKCLCKTSVSEKAKGVNRFSLRFILSDLVNKRSLYAISLPLLDFAEDTVFVILAYRESRISCSFTQLVF